MPFENPEQERWWRAGYDAGRRADKVSAATIRKLQRRIQKLKSTPEPPPCPASEVVNGVLITYSF